MKKLIKIGLLSVALLATVVVNASNKLSVKVASGNSKMLSISLTEVTLGETVYIEDFKGEVLFSENLLASDKYNKVFNLSSLPTGVYFIGSKEESKMQVTPIVINENNVALIKNSTKTYLAPEVTIEEGVLRVLIGNHNKEKVSIEVYDESGTLLDSTDSNTNALVYGSYEISDIESKTITISVSEGDCNFTKEFKL